MSFGKKIAVTLLVIIIIVIVIAWGFLLPMYMRDVVEANIARIESELGVKISYESIGFIPFTTSIFIDDFTLKPESTSWFNLLRADRITLKINIIRAMFSRGESSIPLLEMENPTLVISWGKNSSGSALDEITFNDVSGSVSDCNRMMVLLAVLDGGERRFSDRPVFETLPDIMVKNGRVVLKRAGKLLILIDSMSGKIGDDTEVEGRVFGEHDCTIKGSIRRELTLERVEVDTDELKQVLLGEIKPVFCDSRSYIEGKLRGGDKFQLNIDIKGGKLILSHKERIFEIESAKMMLNNDHLIIRKAELSYKGNSFIVEGMVNMSGRDVSIRAHSPEVSTDVLAKLLLGKSIPDIVLPGLGSVLFEITGTIDEPRYRVRFERAR